MYDNQLNLEWIGGNMLAGTHLEKPWLNLQLESQDDLYCREAAKACLKESYMEERETILESDEWDTLYNSMHYTVQEYFDNADYDIMVELKALADH